MVAAAALGLFACATTTPKADSPATAAANAAPAASAASAPAAAAPGAVGSTASQPEAPKAGSAPVTYLPKDKVAATFAKGGSLYSLENYKISAGHRDDAKKPAEVHTKDTDIFYIVDGSATFVTGGELVDGTSTEPDELRGPSIKGGEPHKLQKGDVIVIPRGIPHHFTEVTGPFKYFVVKVR
jgi:mannose-6-phosphate isomerase-like protein (cupin superfamily)